MLLSPVIDWSAAEATALDARERDPFLSPTYARRCGIAMYRDEPPCDLLAVDKTEWPPVLIQVGGTEALRTEIATFADTFSAPQSCLVEIWPGQVHVFQGLATLVPEGRVALRQLGQFAAQHVHGMRACRDEPRR